MDSALAITTIVATVSLALLTAFYAWQTKRTVDEMHQARLAGVRPFLGLSLEMLGGLAGFVCIHNAGTGPAIDVNVSISWLPGGETYTWTNPLVGVGDRVRFKGPGERGFYFNELSEKFETVRLTGSCRDSQGIQHEVDYQLKLRDF